MPQRAILRAASIATHSSQSKPYAIRNLLSLLKMQPNIRKRNIGNFTNFSNLATLAVSSERGPPNFRPLDNCLGWQGIGIEILDPEWFSGIIGIADQT
jgi:hypothetical protein